MPAPRLPRVARAIRNACVSGLSALLATVSMAQVAESTCGNPFVNGHGPFDYRTERGAKLKIVEDFHFNSRVEGLVSGMSGSIEGDLAFTLRAFPNHHRALISMMNLSARLKMAKRPADAMPFECYFVRAVKFRPDDPLARMIYAKFLVANGRKPEAAAQLEAAARSAEANSFTQYNVGLIYLEAGEMDKALAQAHRAMAMGFTRPDLQQKLQAAGKWSDPPPSAPASQPSDAPGAAEAASAPASAAN